MYHYKHTHFFVQGDFLTKLRYTRTTRADKSCSKNLIMKKKPLSHLIFYSTRFMSNLGYFNRLANELPAEHRILYTIDQHISCSIVTKAIGFGGLAFIFIIHLTITLCEANFNKALQFNVIFQVLRSQMEFHPHQLCTESLFYPTNTACHFPPRVRAVGWVEWFPASEWTGSEKRHLTDKIMTPY